MPWYGDFDECNNNVNLSKIHTACKEASLLIVKETRAAWLSSVLNSHRGNKANKLLPHDSLVIHLTRSPVHVFKSQYDLGWFGWMPLPEGVDGLAYHAARICKEMIETKAIVDAHDPDKVLPISYADIIDDFDTIMENIFEFVSTPLTAEAKRDLAAIRNAPHADLPKGYSLDLSDAADIIRKQPECAPLISRHNKHEL